MTVKICEVIKVYADANGVSIAGAEVLILSELISRLPELALVFLQEENPKELEMSLKSEDLVMFNGQLCDKEVVALLIREVVPTVCEVVKQKISNRHSAEEVEEAALSCVNAITKAIVVKSLVSPKP